MGQWQGQWQGHVGAVVGELQGAGPRVGQGVASGVGQGPGGLAALEWVQGWGLGVEPVALRVLRGAWSRHFICIASRYAKSSGAPLCSLPGVL